MKFVNSKEMLTFAVPKQTVIQILRDYQGNKFFKNGKKPL